MSGTDGTDDDDGEGCGMTGDGGRDSDPGPFNRCRLDSGKPLFSIKFTVLDVDIVRE